MFDVLQTLNEEGRNAELKTAKNGEHSVTETEALKTELKSLMEEKKIEEIKACGLDNSYNHIVRVLLDAPIDSPVDSFLHADNCTSIGRVITSSVISRGPHTGIAGADMRIISHELPETQARYSGEDNTGT